ncbi:MAG: sigma-70 family RNA polymerase sigma factor [Bacilli bacterium]|nr:sigma-70 family RNA polymerase sigma factor [Bacilli bacterium]
MANNKVEITGINTSSLKRISNDEMTKLFEKLKLDPKDKISREKLTLGNLKLVLSILKKYNNRNENMDDLFQIGCIGLVKAIDNFDLSFGVKFSTYSVLMIEGEIRKYLRDNNTIRVSRSVKDTAYKVIKFKNEYMMSSGKEPSIEEISKSIDISPQDILFSMEATKNIVSYYEPIYDDGGETIYLFDQISNGENKDSLSNKLALKEAISGLKSNEKKILYDRYIIGKTQIELSEELNISQAQISRIEKNAISNIKKLVR